MDDFARLAESAGTKPVEDHGEGATLHPLSPGSLLGGVRQADENPQYLGHTHIVAHQASLLRAIEQASDSRSQLTPCARHQLCHVDAGSRERLNDSALLRGLLDEMPEEREERLPLPIGHQGIGGRRQLSQARPEQLFEQRFLRRKVPKHGADTDPGEPGDFFGRRGRSAFAEYLLGRVEDTDAISSRVGTKLSLWPSESALFSSSHLGDLHADIDNRSLNSDYRNGVCTHINRPGVASTRASRMDIVVMTGGTSGLGAAAARRLVESRVDLLLGARGHGPYAAPSLPLDLTKLDDVRAFATKVERRLGAATIDALVLNAGGYARGRTADGYDATFVLNHLAHYLLIRLLWHRISDGGRVVLTTSGTHDPAEHTIIPPPRHANATWLATPELDPNRDRSPRAAAGRAYSSSKLCVVLTVRALAARTDTQTRRIHVIAYDPGPTPGTGLVREQGALVRLVWQHLAAPLRFVMHKANTIDDAGRTLAALALGTIRPPHGRVYAALRRGGLTWPALSDLARRDDLMVTLWRDSAGLVGLSD
jgi:NAD(P)-dependent dehydrogenase (short-subunit alcohol dehydrogenase family)